MSEEAENWCPGRIWPNVGRGVCPRFPKEIGLAYYIVHRLESVLFSCSGASPLTGITKWAMAGPMGQTLAMLVFNSLIILVRNCQLHVAL